MTMYASSVHKSTDILGIPCSISDPELSKAVRKVLEQIRERFPKDFERLHERILCIRTRKDIGEGTMGEWVGPSGPDPNWAYDHDTPGYIEITEGLSVERHVDVIAHELGHTATHDEDLERRGEVCDEWCSEFTADWYAYKWGFGKEIARFRETLNHLHHGPAPGTSFEEGRGDGRVYHYKVTRNFVVHLTKITERSISRA